MFARLLRSIRAVGLAAVTIVAGAALARGAGPHQKTPVVLTSTLRTEYNILQGDRKMGSEMVEKRVFDNNTVVFVIDAVMDYAQGLDSSSSVSTPS